MEKKNINLIQKVTWAQMLRDVLIAAINKGELPITGSILIVLTILMKMPGEDVSNVAFSLIEKLVHGDLIGWVAFLMTLIGWRLNSRWLRKQIQDEDNRKANQKNILQKKSSLGTKLIK